jgi:hypothetical protein
LISSGFEEDEDVRAALTWFATVSGSPQAFIERLTRAQQAYRTVTGSPENRGQDPSLDTISHDVVGAFLAQAKSLLDDRRSYDIALEAAWSSYKSHLNDSSKPEDEAWHETKERRLAELLFEIAAVLGFKIPALDIFKGGYAPKGWAHRDLRAVGALEYVYELSQGTKSVPVWLAGLTRPQSTAVSLPDETKPRTP